MESLNDPVQVPRHLLFLHPSLGCYPSQSLARRLCPLDWRSTLVAKLGTTSLEHQAYRPQTRLETVTDEASLESLLAAVAVRGLLVANLFQLPFDSPLANHWQANLTDGHQWWEFARGASPQQALARALHLANTTVGSPAIRPQAEPAPSLATVDPKDLGI